MEIIRDLLVFIGAMFAMCIVLIIIVSPRMFAESGASVVLDDLDGDLAVGQCTSSTISMHFDASALRKIIDPALAPS